MFIVSCRSDSGNYSCLAENAHGLGMSNNISVMVEFVPTCLSSEAQMISVSVHESVDLECAMTSRPQNVSFTWKIFPRDTGGGEVEVASSQFTQHSTRSVLTFTPRTPADFGKLECSGANKLGPGKPCIFQINRKVKPLCSSVQRSLQRKDLI